MYTDIKVGYSCNNNCTHCVIEPIKVSLQDGDESIDSSTDTVKTFIDEACDRGSDAVVLTGGEITIRNDFHELIHYALSKDLKVTIQTNARRLANPEMLSFLDNTPKIQFIVAIHAPTADIHDRVTRVPNSFKQTVLAIENLIKHKNAEVCGKLVISKVNRTQLRDTVEFIANLGITRTMMAFPHAEEFPEEVFKQVVPTYLDVQKHIIDALDYARVNGLKLEFETIPYCILKERPEYWKNSLDIKYMLYGSDDQAFIQATGEDELKDWEKLRKQIKTKGEQCNLCVLDKVCEGPWTEYVDCFGHEEFEPVTDPAVVEMI